MSLSQYLEDVAHMRGFVGETAAETMPDGKYDAAESYGMDHPYGYDEEEHTAKH